jgi:hypothetical protein
MIIAVNDENVNVPTVAIEIIIIVDVRLIAIPWMIEMTQESMTSERKQKMMVDTMRAEQPETTNKWIAVARLHDHEGWMILLLLARTGKVIVVPTESDIIDRHDAAGVQVMMITAMKTAVIDIITIINSEAVAVATGATIGTVVLVLHGRRVTLPR